MIVVPSLQVWPDCLEHCQRLLCPAGCGRFSCCSLRCHALQEEDAGLGERRRQSAAGLRGPEQPLAPAMVSHLVDALFDRSVPSAILLCSFQACVIPFAQRHVLPATRAPCANASFVAQPQWCCHMICAPQICCKSHQGLLHESASLEQPCVLKPLADHQTVLSKEDACAELRVEILSDWKSLSAALLEDAAVEARSDASTSNLLLLLRDASHKAVGGQLIPSSQEAR